MAFHKTGRDQLLNSHLGITIRRYIFSKWKVEVSGGRNSQFEILRVMPNAGGQQYCRYVGVGVGYDTRRWNYLEFLTSRPFSITQPTTLMSLWNKTPGEKGASATLKR